MPKLKWVGLSIIILMLDQWTKLLALHFLTAGNPLRIFSFFNFTLAYNTGIAFSFFDFASGAQRFFLVALALFISIGIIIALARTKHLSYVACMALACVLGGALGNLLDRIRLGYVIDFIDLHVQTWHWPIFNIADSFVTIGVLLLFLAMWKKTA